jgi:hypothetical protein
MFKREMPDGQLQSTKESVDGVEISDIFAEIGKAVGKQ